VTERALQDLLRDSHLAAAHDLPALLRRHVRGFGALDASLYLVDLQQTVLIPFLEPAGPEAGQYPDSLPIDSTLAGRAYQQVTERLQRHRDGRAVVWVPLLDGIERLGVLAATVAPDTVTGDSADAGEAVNADVLATLRALASLMAEFVMTKTNYGDTVVRLRRTGAMGLAAELQWSLLPPLTFATREVTIAAALEPAYDVAGDTFDYAVDPGIATAAVFDGMGHGLRSAQLAAMSVTAYRHARRAGMDLSATALHVDDALITTFGGEAFTTAVLAELETGTGLLRWVNAGHPEPLLLRRNRLVKSLRVQPRLPLGLHMPGAQHLSDPDVGVEQLEPGDCVLLYTDGVTEARSPSGDFFGDERLADLITRSLADGLPAPETMRRAVRALLEHQQGRLSDDASLALLQWRGDVRSLTD
jgi:serine phosphatase RsbU (regulator of sigma subunit)